jgi:hypothetical protein
MSNELDSIEKQVSGERNYDAPPLQLWHPELSGDIDIQIKADGSWYHEGAKISREAIVQLFASILRREDDGGYYLVTPGEKWRIAVDVHPLLVTDVNWGEGDKEGTVQATLNTGKKVDIDQQHPLFLEPDMDNIAAIKLPHGLAALFSRNAWYRLVEMAEHRQDHVVVVSGGQSYILG